MSLYRPFYNGKYGVVDLTSLSAYTVDLPWEACQDHIGGAAMMPGCFRSTRATASSSDGTAHGEFRPASALLVGRSAPPVNDHLCHVPFMLRSGPELKFSGLDALVIRGAAKEPCALSVGRGQVRALVVPELPGKPVPELLQLLRRSAPGFRASIVSGPSADNNSPFASASIGGHGSFDKVGLAARMAAKNLKAVLFNGIEGLPFREDHPALSKATQKILCDSGALAADGFVPVLKKLADGSEAAGALRGKLGRNRACYHCPCPCMTYAAPGKPGPEKEGVLLMDHAGWAALSRKSEDALPLLKKCMGLGLDPCAVGNALREDRPLREAMNAVEALAQAGASMDEEDYPSAPGIDSRTYRLFGGGSRRLLP